MTGPIVIEHITLSLPCQIKLSVQKMTSGTMSQLTAMNLNVNHVGFTGRNKTSSQKNL